MSEITQNIIEALKAGGMVKAERVRSELEKQRLQQEAQFRMEEAKHQQDQVKNQQDQLKQQHEQFLVEQKAAAAVHNLGTVKLQAELSQHPGILESIGKRIASKFGPAEGQSPLDPNQEIQENTWELPIPQDIANPQAGNVQVTAPTEQRQAIQQANLERITQAPKNEAELAKIGAQGQEAFSRALMQKEWDDNRNQATITANRTIQASHDVARITAANIAHSADMADFNIAPYIQGAATGDVTSEDINKIPSKKIALVITGALSKIGVTPITKEQKDTIQEYRDVSDTMKLWDQFLDNAPKTTNWTDAHVAGAVNTLNPALTNLQDQLMGRSLLIAKAVSKQSARGISDRDAKVVAGGYLPDRFKPLAENIKTRNNFIRDMSSAIDAKLYNLPPEQRALIKEKLGVNNLTMYNQGNQPTQQQQTTTPPRIKILSVE